VIEKVANVFVTGGTGYMGRRLIGDLLARGHTVRALVRPGSEAKVPSGADAVIGDALDAASYADRVAPSDPLVQLVGVPHPSPAKASEFRAIDLPSGLAAVEASKQARAHLVTSAWRTRRP
jgi:nucleoside-diphosphate-sugar epimerase